METPLAVENNTQKRIQELLREAIAHYVAEQYEAMLHTCEQALEVEKESAQAHHEKAVALIGLGRFEEAVTSLKRPFELTRGALRYYQAWIIAEKARVLYALGRSAEVLRAYEEATMLSPKD